MSNIVRIPLTRSLFALIDESDVELISKFKWYAHRNTTTGCFYAYSYDSNQYIIRTRTKIQIAMHRIIMAVDDSSILVDHWNRNTLDNTRKNLRRCSKSENNRNTNVRRNSASKYLGVWRSTTKTWRAGINVLGKKYSLGSYVLEEDAARAYNIAAIKYFGEFANLNNV